MSRLLSIPENPFAYDVDRLLTAIQEINSDLARVGINFEGIMVPYSTVATAIPEALLRPVAEAGEAIHVALERLLTGFVLEHRSGLIDAPLHRLFTPFYRWWDHIALEQRSLRPINLMRFDAIVDDMGQWSLVENNTACPGGVINCAYIRQAWLKTDIAINELQGQQLVEYTIDDPTGFIQVLDELLSKVPTTAKSIALLNYRGAHTNELGSLKDCFDRLKELGEVQAKNLILGDIRDIECDGGKAFLNGEEIGLIYCKLPPFTLDPSDPEISGWISSLRSSSVEQVNSLGAMFLTEAKRSIAGLFQPHIRAAIDLSERQIDAIETYYPRTWIASDQLALDPNSLAMDEFVLKADSLTRGRGVFVANNETTQTEWSESIREVVNLHGVVQQRCDIPVRKVPSLVVPRGLDIVTEHFGVDLFYFQGSFGGVVGRSHTDQVFNVGNGGRETPVVILKEKFND